MKCSVFVEFMKGCAYIQVCLYFSFNIFEHNLIPDETHLQQQINFIDKFYSVYYHHYHSIFIFVNFDIKHFEK